jgi:hypothetical protein
METNGISTMGQYAFSCGGQAGSTDEQPLINMLQTILGAAPSLAVLASARRLHFEAHALSLDDLRYRLEKPLDSAPRRMAPAERASRHAEQTARLVGIAIEGENEPSHQLQDLVMSQSDEDCLRYIPLSQSTRRDQELLGVRLDTAVKLDLSGAIKIQKESNRQYCDVSSDLLVKQAMVRRALAYDQSGLITWSVSDTWIRTLFLALYREPPAGLARPTLAQAVLADQELHLRAADMTRAGIVPQVGRPRPLDEAFTTLMTSPEVRLLLMPTPAPRAVTGMPCL